MIFILTFTYITLASQSINFGNENQIAVQSENYLESDLSADHLKHSFILDYKKDQLSFTSPDNNGMITYELKTRRRNFQVLRARIHKDSYIGREFVFADRLFVYEGVKIGDGVCIGNNNLIFNGTELRNRIVIGNNNLIGNNKIKIEELSKRKFDQTSLMLFEGFNEDIETLSENNILIMDRTVIGNDNKLNKNVYVGEGCNIGNRNNFVEFAVVCDRANIGNENVVESSKIEKGFNLGSNQHIKGGKIILIK